MFPEIKSIIPKSKNIELLEKETLVYEEGEPFLYDAFPYSTYLFVFPNEQFTVYYVSMLKAVTYVEKIKKEESLKKVRYAVVNLTAEHEFKNQSKRNNIVNHISESLFEKK